MRRSKKADIEISTLILLIATVIIAAVAITLILSTQNALSSKALSTAKKTQRDISTFVLPIQLYGENGSTGDLDYFYEIVKTGPGSQPLRLSQTKILMGTINTSTTYTYDSSMNCSIRNANSPYSIYNTSNNAVFGVTYLLEGNTHIDGYINDGDITKLCWQSNRSIVEDEELNVKILPEYGTPLTLSPKVYGPINKERIDLYPYLHFD